MPKKRINSGVVLKSCKIAILLWINDPELCNILQIIGH